MMITTVPRISGARVRMPNTDKPSRCTIHVYVRFNLIVLVLCLKVYFPVFPPPPICVRFGLPDSVRNHCFLYSIGPKKTNRLTDRQTDRQTDGRTEDRDREMEVK